MKTVRVRIAVGVDESGDWNAVGWRTADPAWTGSDVLGNLDGHVKVLRWVEADIPVPDAESVTVEGEVVK